MLHAVIYWYLKPTMQLKVDLDQQNINEFSFPTVAIVTSPVSVEHPLGIYDYYTANYVNPPPPDSREILLEKQVWII